jgi:SH3-like domain-containing protein
MIRRLIELVQCQLTGVVKVAGWSVVATLAASHGWAAEYRSIADAAVIMYDAPSVRATKLFVASRNLPVEVISTDGTWVKVRDPAGDLSWVDRKSLSERRTVIVISVQSDVRQSADEQAPVAFQVGQGVVLELLDPSGSGPGNVPGWARVRHRDGVSGFLRIRELWGL